MERYMKTISQKDDNWLRALRYKHNLLDASGTPKSKMRLQYAILVMMLLSASHQHEVVKRESGGEKRIVCYYTNWSVYRPGTAKFNPQNINPYLCTHLIYAFGGLDRENGLRPYDKYQDIEQGGYAKFTGLKTYNKALKTMLAIGGWNEGSARFSPLVADEERRREFVKNVVKFLRINHFDGLDLDWEYPAYRDGGKPKDKENYAQLVQELREEFERESDKTGRPRLLLTMAVPAGIEYIDKGYDIPRLNKYLDFMNILSYDYHSAFEPSVNHHSPLYSIEEESEYNFDSQLTIDASVKHYILKGADPEKLVLGIPTYGRSYTLFNVDSTDLGSPSDGPGEQGDATREKGYLAYYEICANVKDGWTVVQPKETALGPYAYKGNQWVGYDDENIVKRKSQYVNEKNLGGIMFWSIDNDDFRGKCHSRPYPLIEAAKEALIGKASGVASNKLPTPPRGGKGTGISKSSSKLKNHRIPSTTTPAPVTQTTPDPPTTPDPGSDFRCKDEGFFPHPRDCKKYFWCLDSGPSNLGIVAHQFTCPSGLFFNKASDSCDFARNVICKKKSADSTTTTTTTPKSSSGSKSATTARTTTTTTTTTTEAPIPEEEEYYEEQEDPQTIKQLISLIKKLGGVAELEKQLESNSNTDSTTPAISKTLYERVISNKNNRYQTLQRNGPTGPQNEGLPRESGRSSSFRNKDKPTYVTIRRERPTTEKLGSEEYEEAVEEEVAPVEQERPKYTPIQRNRGSQFDGIELEKPTDRSKLKYQSVERFRPKVRDSNKNPTEEEVVEEEAQAPASERRQQSSTLRYTNIFRSRSSPPDTATSTTSRYVTLQRQRPQPSESEDVVTTENELIEDEEMTEERILETTTTQRPRVKVSEVLTTTPGVRTSTRVVTQIVEGATKRQKVPLHMLQQLLKDSENFVDSVTKPYSREVTQEAVTVAPRVANFRTRRPIVITTTVRTTPAYIALRRNRLKTTSTTEASDTTTKHKGFIPSRSRSTTESSSGEVDDPERKQSEEVDKDKPTRGFFPRQRTTTGTTQSTTRKHFERNRFAVRRTTTTASPQEEEDQLFTREYSRDTNVIRRPVSKPRFPSRRLPTTPTTESLTEVPSSTEKSTSISSLEISSSTENHNSTQSSSPNSITDSTTELVKDSTEIPVISETTSPMPQVLDVENTTLAKIESSEASSELPAITTPVSVTIPVVEITTPSHSETTQYNHRFTRPRNNAVQIISVNETLNGTFLGDNDHGSRNRTKIILRRKKPTEAHAQINTISHSTHKPVSREKVIIRRKKPEPTPKALDVTDEDYGFLDNSVSSSTISPQSRGRTRFVTSIKDELDEDQTTATSHLRSRTTAGDRSSTRRSSNNVATTRSQSRSALDRGTTVSGLVTESAKTRSRGVSNYETTIAPSTNDIDARESRFRGRSRTTRTYEEVSRNTERTTTVSESREARSRLRSREQDTTRELHRTDDRRRQRVIADSSEHAAAGENSRPTRILQRGQKRFKLDELVSNEDIKAAAEDEIPHKQSSQTRNLVTAKRNHGTDDPKKKVRRVVLRKPVKDLAVGASGIPDQETYYNGIDEDPSRGSVKIYDSLLNEDLEQIDFADDVAQNGDVEGDGEISRSRRPFNRRPGSGRTTTTTTSTEVPTTPRQRTTVQILKQRLNRFKSERGQQLRGTTTSTESIALEEEEASTTLRPRKAEFRRVIRPSSVQSLEGSQQLDSSIEQSVAKDTVTKTRQYHRETSFRPQGHLRQTVAPVPRTEPPQAYVQSEPAEVATVAEPSSFDSDESIPDLANVAVAAIQSLATLPPTSPTEQYITTTIRPTYREIIETTQRPRPPPTRPHRPPSTTPVIIPVRSVARSSPRPFSKVIPGAVAPQGPLRPIAAVAAGGHLRPVRPASGTLYDEYDDFYAEPVDIPLSGKVRIHNDGYIECLDIGNFPHPFSCRKFISCAKMENSHLLGWEYTCPKGLSFDPIGGICNWNAGLGCKE
ncbi:hypothetical protein GE061_002457 [Apolygus lucorum]|uniref:Chitinase n=1 Tax=Apolygus lucorum TaxID=248454 RepID=A0A8S9X570_APOLU|nr:hypothetical protein GE061_002457 [Apolygus lucorum]